MTGLAVHDGGQRRPRKVRADRKLTDEDVRQICDMRERGKSYGTIHKTLTARGISISESSIARHCLLNGADLPPERRRTTTQAPGRVMRRGDHFLRRFTPAEDNRIREMALRGCSYAKIAAEIGRSRSSIYGRLATLARLDARQEEETIQ